MKRLLLIFLITILSSPVLFSQVKMNMRVRIKDTLVVDKYTQMDNGFKCQMLKMAPGSWHVENEKAVELLQHETIIAVDLIYSDYPEGEDFTELNRRRLVELFGYLPDAFNRPVVDWRVVKQTGVAKTGGLQNYFHGFAVYYRPMPTNFAENELIKDIVEGRRPPSDSTILKVFGRNPDWQDMLVVCDVTGSMSPYTAQLLLWLKANQELRGMKNLLFFNDDDENSHNQATKDDPTGMWTVSSTNYKEVMAVALKAMEGGQHFENNLEAICAAVKKFPEGKQKVVMIADNWEDPCDMQLLSYLKSNNIPVRVVLCGVNARINTNYLDIVRATGGTFHTIEQDLTDLAKLKEGAIFNIGDVRIMLLNGKFVQIN